MTELIPDLLRAVVSNVMEVVLLITLLKPRHDKKVTNLAMLGIIIINLLLTVYCYIYGNLTMLSKLDVLLFTVLCFAIKPLFQDSIMQWLFSYITIQNINLSVMVLSFLGSRHLPYPPYANTVLRLAMYLAIVFMLRRYIRPLFRQMEERWNVFFYVAVAVNVALLYYFVGSNDVVYTITENALPMLLLIIVAVAAYTSILYSLKTLSREYNLREENMKMQNGQALLRLSAMSMERRLSVMDEAARQMSIVNHDRRHFNNALLELLRRGLAEGAVSMLEQQTQCYPTPPKSFCENPAVNASVCYYAALAKESGIECDIRLDIPAELSMDSLELAMSLSNLMENAIQACGKLEPGVRRYLHCIGLYTGQLILEVQNPFAGEIHLDENGRPAAFDERHGIGTKSVLAFAARYNGQVLYNINEGIFNVRLIL